MFCSFRFGLIIIHEQLQQPPSDEAQNCINGKEQKEAHHSKDNVREFHGTCVCDFLTNLNSKGDYQNQSKGVNKRDYHGVIVSGKPCENWMDNHNKEKTQKTDHNKVQLFVRKIEFIFVIQAQKLVVQDGYEANNFI